MKHSPIYQNASKLVAVVVPLSNREKLTPDEEISLRHLEHYLGRYDRFLVAPRALQMEISGFSVKRFDKQYFGSVAAHRRLLFSSLFYESFRDYKYILIYHLDALVFSDQLTEWCLRDYDYIGPPWIKHADAPYAGNRAYEGKVGNGGFSLRKVSSFLGIINSGVYYKSPSELWELRFGDKPRFVQFLNLYKKLLFKFRRFNSARVEMARFDFNDERFWANRAAHYYPEFNIAPVEVALKFGFECVPRYCFEKNGRRLPFGCHAWPQYDRSFWTPHLLTA